MQHLRVSRSNKLISNHKAPFCDPRPVFHSAQIGARGNVQVAISTSANVTHSPTAMVLEDPIITRDRARLFTLLHSTRSIFISYNARAGVHVLLIRVSLKNYSVISDYTLSLQLAPIIRSSLFSREKKKKQQQHCCHNIN